MLKIRVIPPFLLSLMLSISPAGAGQIPFELPEDFTRHLVAPHDFLLDERYDAIGGKSARIKAAIWCEAWARDMIDQHWTLLDRTEGQGSWSAARQSLWIQPGWIDEFARDFLDPQIDGETRTTMRSTWWPEGVGTLAGSPEALNAHDFCRYLPGLLYAINPVSPHDREADSR